MQKPDIAPGVVIDGKYRLDHQIGQGGIGTVWAAWQDLVQRKVAIKFLKVELATEQRDRFLVEARALGRLNHPNCITIFDFGYSESHEVLYLVMEYLEGFALCDWRGRHTPVADVIEVGKQVTSALAFAHHQSVFHRDLKPENVFLVQTYDGETLVKVLDFGLARIGETTGDRLTKTGEIFGTPAYMSPEQIRGTRNAGAASDIYSVGIIMYELIERRLPFENMAPFDVMMAHVSQPVPPMRRSVPFELEEIVYRCLEKDAAARFGSALELWKALSAISVGLEEDSTNFVSLESPDATLEGTPPGKWDPTDFESTLDDEEKKPVAKAELPTMLLSHAHPTLTAVSAPDRPLLSRKDIWLAVGVGLSSLLLVTLFIVLISNDGAAPVDTMEPSQHEAVAPEPPEKEVSAAPDPVPANVVDEKTTGAIEVREPRTRTRPKRIKRPRQKRPDRDDRDLQDDRKNTVSP